MHVTKQYEFFHADRSHRRSRHAQNFHSCTKSSIMQACNKDRGRHSTQMHGTIIWLRQKNVMVALIRVVVLHISPLTWIPDGLKPALQPTSTTLLPLVQLQAPFKPQSRHKFSPWYQFNPACTERKQDDARIKSCVQCSKFRSCVQCTKKIHNTQLV